MSTDLTAGTGAHRPATAEGAIAPRRPLLRELSDFVARAVGPDFVPRLARFVGEDEARTEAAFTLLFSAAVRRIARVAESREATERLFARLHGRQVSIDLSEALTLLLGDREQVGGDLAATADEAAHALFGRKAGSLVLSVGTATGMAFDSVWKVACLVAPFAYAAVADHCTRNDLDAAGLRSLLATVRNGSRRSRRRRAGRALRQSGSDAVEAVFEGGLRAMKRTGAALREARARTRETSRARFAVPALLVAIAASAAVLAFNDDHPQIPTAHAETARALKSVSLPDGQSLEVRREGPVDRMVAFLAEDAKGERVFMLDGIRFDGQSATLRSASRAQLEQVAAVLSAFPGARVSIEAPAERPGAPEEERGLAEQRALAVRAALGSFGVRPSRMAHSAGPHAERPTETGSLRYSDGLIALRVTNG